LFKENAASMQLQHQIFEAENKKNELSIVSDDTLTVSQLFATFEIGAKNFGLTGKSSFWGNRKFGKKSNVGSRFSQLSK
jgi:hypothetical protein